MTAAEAKAWRAVWESLQPASVKWLRACRFTPTVKS